MRAAFVDGLCRLAKNNPRIMLITGDLGYRFLDKFAVRFPGQFLNIGVAEANLVSVAAGLSTCGFVPFIYSIATFVSMRAFEQIRTDIVLQNLNVKIVGIGAGMAYTKAGPTHHSYEDIALMRTLPRMTIVDPIDTFETLAATLAIAKLVGPAYLRIERNPEVSYHTQEPDFQIGKGYVAEKGEKLAILFTGTKLGLASQIADKLHQKNIHPTIAVMPTIKPVDFKLINSLAKKHKYFVTVEEHSVVNGFGTGILEYLNECGISDQIRLKRFGLRENFKTQTGDYQYLLSQNQLTPEIISTGILKWMRHG